MKRRAVLVLPLLMALSACERETIWNQRLTIAVETPTGEMRGSSATKIVKTESSGSLLLPKASEVRSSVIDEALIIEVTPGSYLFALLSGSGEEKRGATHWVHSAYKLGDAQSCAAEMNIVKSEPCDMQIPMLPSLHQS